MSSDTFICQGTSSSRRAPAASARIVDRSIHTGVERTYTYDDDVSIDGLSPGLKYC
jgi:hypothetical protein